VQTIHYLPVPATVGIDLVAPEVRTTSWPLEQRALVTMPETPVNKHDCTMSSENHIRFSWESASVQAEPETRAVQQASHHQLWSRIGATYAGHHPAASLPVDNVGHRSAR